MRKKMDAKTEVDGGLYTVMQAASFLHCGKKKVYELARDGQIDMVKLGHSTRVTEASLRKLISELPRRGPAEK